jgi:nucleotide-binding universal stress UspA family protein
MRVVLVPLDFSPVSDAVVAWAARLAERFECQMWLLHVAAPDPEFVGYEAGPDVVRDQRASELREEHRELQSRAESLRERGIDARALLVEGPTVQKILSEAEKVSTDLIVMGSHGHGALHRALLGSVSEGVVRGAHCPVTIVPARSTASEQPA